MYYERRSDAKTPKYSKLYLEISKHNFFLPIYICLINEALLGKF